MKNSIQTTKADENSVVSGESSIENPFLIESCSDQIKFSHPLCDHYGNNTSENEYSFHTNAQNIRGSSYDETATECEPHVLSESINTTIQTHELHVLHNSISDETVNITFRQCDHNTCSVVYCLRQGEL